MFSCDVELACSGRLRPDRDTDVDQKTGADDEIGKGLQLHRLFLVDVVFLVQPVHAPRVIKNQRDEADDGSLLREPKPKFEAEDLNPIERIDKNDAETERDDEPDRETNRDKAKVGAPVLLSGFFRCHALSPEPGFSLGIGEPQFQLRVLPA